jgi:hypothetical protein
VAEAVLTRAVSRTVLWAGLGATVIALPIALGIHYIGKVPLLSGSRQSQIQPPGEAGLAESSDREDLT